jgi:hypothetical protein
MKKDTKYNLIPSGHALPIGFFLDGYYYGQPFGDSIKQGKVDEKGNFFSFISEKEATSDQPIAKIEGLKYIRLSDSVEFQLVEEV